MGRRILIFLIVCVAGGVAAAQESDRCYQLYGGLTYSLDKTAIKESSVYPTGGLRFGVNTLPATSSPYAAYYGYPTIGLDIGWHGLEHLRYHDGSHLENIVTLSTFFERDIWRSSLWSLGYGVNFGLGLNSATYEPELNPLNTHFSSPLLIYLGGGILGKYHPTAHWEIGLAVRFAHFSTGRLAYPNNGLNLMETELSVRYNLSPPYRPNGEKPAIDYRRLWGEVAVGGGLHRCANEWRAFGSTTPWPNYTQGLAVFYRYTPTLSTGFGLDMVYASDAFLQRVEAAERMLYGDAAVDACPGYENISTGLSLTQQFHYGNVAIYGTFGVYTHRYLGLHEQEGWCYQKAGVKLYIPRLGGLFLSADCLAHSFSHAVMIEFNIGYKI